MIHPFSILDTRSKYWKERDKYWTNSFGIRSELGRSDTVSKTQFWDTESNVSIFSPSVFERLIAASWRFLGSESKNVFKILEAINRIKPTP